MITLEEPDNVALNYGNNKSELLLDGFTLDDDKEKLAGAPYMLRTKVGKGHVIYFASDPTFRGYWYSIHKLFLNALTLGNHE